MRVFLQGFEPAGVVYSERWRWPLKREFTVTGPASVMEDFCSALREIQDDLRIARSYATRERA